MSNRSSRSYKTGFYIYGLAALFLINIPYLVFPIYASYGGQWARESRGGMFGWGDLAFYPQTRLYPLDIFLYITTLIILIWLARSYILKRNYKALPGLCLVAGLLPIIWTAITFAGGFNYEKCNTPSQAFACENPTQRIIQRLALGVVIAAFTFFCIKIINNKNKGRNSKNGKRVV